MAGKLSLVPQANAGQGGEAPDATGLLVAGEVASLLRISPKKVYALPIPRVELSPGRVRWMATDVYAFIRRARRAA